jgi:hypothetical protein
MLSKQKLKIFFTLYLIWSLIGIYADWLWLSMIPSYLIPFTAICSLYPPLLTIWYGLKLAGKTPPNWLTLWIASGTAAYGVMAQLYFPLLMSWKGINFHDVGSMFWVAVYGSQTFVISRYLRQPKWSEIAFVLLFFAVADFSHYQLKTFVDFILPGYPLWLMNLTVVLGILSQIAALSFYTVLKFKPQPQAQTAEEMVPD